MNNDVNARTMTYEGIEYRLSPSVEIGIRKAGTTDPWIEIPGVFGHTINGEIVLHEKGVTKPVDLYTVNFHNMIKRYYDEKKETEMKKQNEEDQKKQLDEKFKAKKALGAESFSGIMYTVFEDGTIAAVLATKGYPLYINTPGIYSWDAKARKIMIKASNTAFVGSEVEIKFRKEIADSGLLKVFTINGIQIRVFTDNSADITLKNGTKFLIADKLFTIVADELYYNGRPYIGSEYQRLVENNFVQPDKKKPGDSPEDPSSPGLKPIQRNPGFLQKYSGIILASIIGGCYLVYRYKERMDELNISQGRTLKIKTVEGKTEPVIGMPSSSIGMPSSSIGMPSSSIGMPSSSVTRPTIPSVLGGNVTYNRRTGEPTISYRPSEFGSYMPSIGSDYAPREGRILSALGGVKELIFGTEAERRQRTQLNAQLRDNQQYSADILKQNRLLYEEGRKNATHQMDLEERRERSIAAEKILGAKTDIEVENIKNAASVKQKELEQNRIKAMQDLAMENEEKMKQAAFDLARVQVTSDKYASDSTQRAILQSLDSINKYYYSSNEIRDKYTQLFNKVQSFFAEEQKSLEMMRQLETEAKNIGYRKEYLMSWNKTYFETTSQSFREILDLVKDYDTIDKVMILTGKNATIDELFGLIANYNVPVAESISVQDRLNVIESITNHLAEDSELIKEGYDLIMSNLDKAKEKKDDKAIKFYSELSGKYNNLLVSCQNEANEINKAGNSKDLLAIIDKFNLTQENLIKDILTFESVKQSYIDAKDFIAVQEGIRKWKTTFESNVTGLRKANSAYNRPQFLLELLKKSIASLSTIISQNNNEINGISEKVRELMAQVTKLTQEHNVRYGASSKTALSNEINDFVSMTLQKFHVKPIDVPNLEFKDVSISESGDTFNIIVPAFDLIYKGVKKIGTGLLQSVVPSTPFIPITSSNPVALQESTPIKKEPFVEAPTIIDLPPRKELQVSTKTSKEGYLQLPQSDDPQMKDFPNIIELGKEEHTSSV